MLSNAMAHIVSVLGERHEAHRLLDDARRMQSGSSFNRMYTESLAGLLDLREGRLRQASARLRMAVSATPHAPSYTHTNGNAWAGVLYAGVVYEANELQAAEHLLNVYLPLARDVGLPDHMILSYRMRTRIAFQRGDVDAAFELLTELEYLGHHRQLPRVVASAKLERARLLLLQGNGPASRDELNRADDGSVWSRVRVQHLQAHDVDDMQIGRLRWEIHFGDAAAAQALAQALRAAAVAEGSLHRALRLGLLQALALHRSDSSGSSSEGLAQLAELLLHAGREGFVRLILDEGQALAPLVQRVHLLATQDSRRTDDPIFLDYLQRLLDGFGVAVLADDAEGEAHAGPEPTQPAEPLTLKEIRVLKLLAEGYSNSAMAEKLFVSDSTVRTHLRNINSKLKAHSRTQALAIARRLRVIA
jgi:LuxR family maltose regulon positive regulatory protein